jgi:hypothetical protein
MAKEAMLHRLIKLPSAQSEIKYMLRAILYAGQIIRYF